MNAPLGASSPPVPSVVVFVGLVRSSSARRAGRGCKDLFFNWHHAKESFPAHRRRLLAQRAAVPDRRAAHPRARPRGRPGPAGALARGWRRCGRSRWSTPTCSAASRPSCWSSCSVRHAGPRAAGRPEQPASSGRSSRWSSPTAPTSPRSSGPASSRCIPRRSPAPRRSALSRAPDDALRRGAAGRAARRTPAAQRLRLAAEGHRPGRRRSACFDALFAARDYAAYNFNYTPLVVVALFFVAMTVPLARFTDWLARRDGAAREHAGRSGDARCSRSRDLRKTYGDRVVLDDVDLTVQPARRGLPDRVVRARASRRCCAA